MFEHTWRELELWLEHLDSTAEEHKETIIQFLERVSAELHGRSVLWGSWLSHTEPFLMQPCQKTPAVPPFLIC